MSDINNWSATADVGYQFDTAPPDGAPEFHPASSVNNIQREVMAAVRRQWELGGWFNYYPDGTLVSFVDTSTFRIINTHQLQFTVGRRVRVELLADNFVYGNVASVVDAGGGNIDVTLTMDGGDVLDANVSVTWLGDTPVINGPGGSSSWPDGSVTMPGAHFTLDPDTGLFRTTDDEIGVAGGGVEIARFAASTTKLGSGAGLTSTVHAGPVGSSGNETIAQFGPQNNFGEVIILAGNSPASSQTGYIRVRGNNSPTGLGDIEMFAGDSGKISVTSGTGDVTFQGAASNDFLVTGFNNFGISANGILNRDGNGATPSYSFVNDPDTGMFRPGGNQLSFTAGGVRGLQVYDFNVRSFLPHRIWAEDQINTATGGGPFPSLWILEGTSPQDWASYNRTVPANCVFLAESQTDTVALFTAANAGASRIQFGNLLNNNLGVIEYDNGTNVLAISTAVAGSVRLHGGAAGTEIDCSFVPQGINCQDVYDNQAAGDPVIVTASGGIRRQSSTVAMKHNIMPLSDDYCADLVKKLDPCTFIWNENPDRGYTFGLIAEEVNNAIPEARGGEGNYDTRAILALVIGAVQHLLRKEA